MFCLQHIRSVKSGPQLMFAVQLNDFFPVVFVLNVYIKFVSSFSLKINQPFLLAYRRLLQSPWVPALTP